MLLLIPQTIIFWNSEALLLALKQDPRVAERGATYLKVRLEFVSPASPRKLIALAPRFSQ